MKGPWWGWWWILGEGDEGRVFGCDVEKMGKAAEIGKVSRSVAINKQKDHRETNDNGWNLLQRRIMKTSGPPMFLEESPGEGVVLIYIRKFHSRTHIKITRYGNPPFTLKYLILNKIAIQWTRILASHADVLRGSSRVPVPTSAWEATRMLTQLARRLNSVYDRDPKPTGLRLLGYNYSLILSQPYRPNKQQTVSVTKDGFLWRNHQKSSETYVQIY